MERLDSSRRLSQVHRWQVAADRLKLVLENAGWEVKFIDRPSCIALMRRFIREHPELWNEDIGA